MRATAGGNGRYWAVGAIMAILMAPGAVTAQTPCCLAEGLAVAAQYRVAGLDDRRFNHEIYWAAMAPALASDRVRVDQVGAADRPQKLLDLLEEAESIKYTRSMARKFCTGAKDSIKLLPNLEAKKALFEIADYIAERNA